MKLVDRLTTFLDSSDFLGQVAFLDLLPRRFTQATPPASYALPSDHPARLAFEQYDQTRDPFKKESYLAVLSLSDLFVGFVAHYRTQLFSTQKQDDALFWQYHALVTLANQPILNPESTFRDLLTQLNSHRFDPKLIGNLVQDGCGGQAVLAKHVSFGYPEFRSLQAQWPERFDHFLENNRHRVINLKRQLGLVI